MNLEIICAGFGGQGILTAGLIMIHAGHKLGKRITWYPSYGSEMRGGTANCNVRISDEAIGNPYCAELDILLAMNGPSVARFAPMLKPQGLLLYNSDAVGEPPALGQDISLAAVDAARLAAEAENPKGQNIVMLGALARKVEFFGGGLLRETVCDFFESRGKGQFNDKNKTAFDLGFSAAAI